MPDVEHANLTGSALHEPKGVAAAAANRVYVTDGLGSGAHSQVSLDVLAPSAKAFQSQLFHAQDVKSPNTDAGTFTGGGWRTRTLNTVLTNEISGASLAANKITLPAGVYWFEASAPAYNVNGHKTAIANTTDGVDAILEGTSEVARSGLGITTRSFVSGRVTIASQKQFELRHICETTASTDGFGNRTNTGTSEHYAEIMIWKIG